MKPIWIVIITVIVTAAIVGGGGYYYLNGKHVKEKNDLQAQIDDLNAKISAAQTALSTATATTGTTSTNSTSSPSSSTTTTTSWKNYTNSKYGFSMTLDDNWKDFKIVEKSATEADAISYMYVCVPTASTTWQDQASGYFCPFSITVVAADKWNDFVSANDPMVPTRIGQNTNYVFAYSTAQDRPDDGVSAMNDIKNIVATFKGI